MTLISALVPAILFALILPAQAQNKNNSHHKVAQTHRNVSHTHHSAWRHQARASLSRHYNDGRPSRWCGWFMRHEVSRDPGPEYNLARNWAHWGQPASGPAPGVIGVMAHHVFKVVQVLAHGLVMAISGNDSHEVRTRPRSTGGVLAWRQG